MLKKESEQFFQKVNKNGLLLILAGTFIWALVMFKSGFVYSYGSGFWGPNGHDGIWHLSLINSLSQGSWKMPVFAGEDIKNYHIGFDLLVVFIHKLTFIPTRLLYFQILPPIISFLIGFFSYKFVYIWRKSHTQAFWSTFFVYFGGSWGWIVTLFRNSELTGESLFWSQQSISTLINPPFAFSLLVLFAGLYVLIVGLDSKEKNLLLISTFLFGILIQIKVYAGILVLMGLFISGLWALLKRNGIALLKVFAGTAIISVLLFSPTTKDVSTTIIYKPFWFLEEMMATSDRFYWQRMASAMANYKLAGNWVRGFISYSIAFFIFWFGNLGTRALKEIQFLKHLKNFKRLTYIEVFTYTVIGLGVIIPTFFIQKGTPWNTIQFMYYSLIFSGILAGTALGEFVERLRLSKFIKSVLITAIVILTIPTTLGTLYYHYLPTRPPAKVSKAELEALRFLSWQPRGVVLTQHFNKKLADAAIDYPPRPLYLYESTAYVSAFSGKPTYLEDELNLEITGYDWKSRREEVEKFFTDPAYDGKHELLEKKGISYVYVVKNVQKGYKDLHLEPNTVFENEEIVIYKNTR